MTVTEHESAVFEYIPPPPDEDRTAERPPLPRPRLRRRTLLREIVDTALLVVAIYTLVNLLTARFIVEGASMSPNFETGQFIIVSRLPYLLNGPQRGDVVVFDSPDDPERDFIKRVIGLPGETIEVRAGLVYVNGVPLDEPYIESPPRYSGTWTLGPDEYFVLGDNRNNSRDSHAFGTLSRDKIIGQAWLIYWPPQDWGIIPHYSYDGSPPLTPTPSPEPTTTPVPPTATPLLPTGTPPPPSP